MHGDAHFTKYFNQRQDASLSLLQKLLKWAQLLIQGNNIIFKKCGTVGSLGPDAISEEGGEFPAIEHCMYPVELHSKFPFDMAVLLWSTWGGELQVQTHSFLLVSHFKSNTVPRTILSYENFN